MLMRTLSLRAQGWNVTPCSPGISAESSRGPRALGPRVETVLSCSIIQRSGAERQPCPGAAAPGPFLRGSLPYYPVLTQVRDRVRDVGRCHRNQRGRPAGWGLCRGRRVLSDIITDGHSRADAGLCAAGDTSRAEEDALCHVLGTSLWAQRSRTLTSVHPLPARSLTPF